MQRITYAMRDNSDVQSIHGGRITDMRIEAVLSAIHKNKWKEPELDQLFTEIIREFLVPDAPLMIVSAAGQQPHTAQGLLYLSMFSLDYELVHAVSDDWPGDFDYLTDATCAVRLQYPEGGKWTDWSPGVTPTSAALASMMQICRELSLSTYNRSGTTKLN